MAKECEIIFNTKWGYCMSPVKCRSVADALKTAKENGMAFRIFARGKLIKSGRYPA